MVRVEQGTASGAIQNSNCVKDAKLECGERVREEEVGQITRPTQAAPRRLNRFNLTPLQHEAVREMRRENLMHACMEISSASDAHRARARAHTLWCLCKADVN